MSGKVTWSKTCIYSKLVSGKDAENVNYKRLCMHIHILYVAFLRLFISLKLDPFCVLLVIHLLTLSFELRPHRVR